MSEDPNFSNDWHKGFQMGLYSGKTTEQERIIKLLEEMPWQIYQAVALDGKILESVSMPKVFNRDDVLALIKGENK